VGLCIALLGVPVLIALSVLYFLESPLLRGLPIWQLIAGGFLSPLGLAISAAAVFRVPKGAATGGVVLGMLGTLYLAGASTLLVANEMELFTPAKELEKLREERSVAAVDRATAIVAKHVAASGSPPADDQGRKLIAGLADGWGKSLQYVLEKDKTFLVISAGSDGEFGNNDDITNKTLAKQREKAAEAEMPDEVDLNTEVP
jgi:hypothetical protein